MTHSLSLDSFEERYEGCKLIAYQDMVNVWTIGYGHTLGVHAGMSITLTQAAQFLDEDLQVAEHAVNALVNVYLTQGEFDALVDFVFQFGDLRFKCSTMLNFINQSDFENAALEFDKWDHAGGQVVASILRRRQEDTQIFDGVETLT